MNLYLLILTSLLLAHIHTAENCQQVGTSSLAQLSLCKVTNPPPQLEWTINIVLKQDYDWKAANDMKYTYLTLDDQIID